MDTRELDRIVNEGFISRANFCQRNRRDGRSSLILFENFR
jgi:hypothetical protein